MTDIYREKPHQLRIQGEPMTHVYREIYITHVYRGMHMTDL